VLYNGTAIERQAREPFFPLEKTKKLCAIDISVSQNGFVLSNRFFPLEKTKNRLRSVLGNGMDRKSLSNPFFLTEKSLYQSIFEFSVTQTKALSTGG